MTIPPRSIVVTGAAGYIGSQLVARLAAEPQAYAVTALDVRELSDWKAPPGVERRTLDIRDPTLSDLVAERRADTVVHLASVVQSRGPKFRDVEHSVDVGGMENVLRACARNAVEQIVVTSSGAAYGYYSDNPVPLHETDPLRGNPQFPYADHKRQVEELLAEYRRSHPALRQLIVRPGAVLGKQADNSITRLFTGPVVVGIRGCETPFVFISDIDLMEILVKGIAERRAGIFNLAGDGVLSLREIARLAGKPYLPIPASVFRLVLFILQKVGLSVYGPEQLIFLQHRPVLSNDRLKREFGYQPRFNSRDAFEAFWRHVQGRRHD